MKEFPPFQLDTSIDSLIFSNAREEFARSVASITKSAGSGLARPLFPSSSHDDRSARTAAPRRMAGGDPDDADGMRWRTVHTEGVDAACESMNQPRWALYFPSALRSRQRIP